MVVIGADTAGREQWQEVSATDLRWKPLSRIVFRFVFAYFVLFSVALPQILLTFTGILGRKLPEAATVWSYRLLRPVVEWLGASVFRTTVVLRTDSGSGDQAFIFVTAFCVLVAAVVAALVWSVLDRRRPHYRTMSAWFLLYIRLCLAGQLLWYGMAKAIPTQMPAPSLTTLLEPYGEFSPASVLWNQVGASTPYEVMLGLAELLCGALLLLPQTAVLGAMLSLLSLAQVFLLNMTFDVSVKLLSFHLVLLAVVLLAPEMPRLVRMFVLSRTVGPSTVARPFRTPWCNRFAVVMQVTLGVWVLIGAAQIGLKVWSEGGGGTPQPPLYGVWNVSEFIENGISVPPLVSSESRWRRLVFDTTDAAYQRLDGTTVPVLAKVDTGTHTVVLADPPQSRDGQPLPTGVFYFEQSAPDRLKLDGQLRDRPVTITLERLDLDTFPLRGRGFHLIQEYDYFR